MNELVIHQLTLRLHGNVPAMVRDDIASYCRDHLPESLDHALHVVTPGTLAIGRIHLDLGLVSAQDLRDRLKGQLAHALEGALGRGGSRGAAGGPPHRSALQHLDGSLGNARRLDGAGANGSALGDSKRNDALNPNAAPKDGRRTRQGQGGLSGGLSHPGTEDSIDPGVLLRMARTRPREARTLLRRVLARPDGPREVARELPDKAGARLARLLDPGRASAALSFRRRLQRAHRRQSLVAPDDGRFGDVAWAAVLASLGQPSGPMLAAIMSRIAKSYGLPPDRFSRHVAVRMSRQEPDERASESSGQTDETRTRESARPSNLPQDASRRTADAREVLFALIEGRCPLPPGTAKLMDGAANGWARETLERETPAILDVLKRRHLRDPEAMSRFLVLLPEALALDLFKAVSASECKTWTDWISSASKDAETRKTARAIAFRTLLEAEPNLSLAHRVGLANDRLAQASGASAGAAAPDGGPGPDTRDVAAGDPVLCLLVASSTDAAERYWILQRRFGTAVARHLDALAQVIPSATDRTAFVSGLLGTKPGQDVATLVRRGVEALAREQGRPPEHVADRLATRAKGLRLRTVLTHLAEDLSVPPLAAGLPADLREPERAEIRSSTAGLVLLWPFLSTAFSRLGYTSTSDFLAESDRIAAARFLLYVAMGGGAPPSSVCVPRLLVGLAPGGSLPEAEPSERERDLARELFEGLRKTWPPVARTSDNGIRESFLVRDGRIQTKQDGTYCVQVSPAPFDLLLDTLEWSLSRAVLPWIKRPIDVEWR
ncbi:MAG: contractile injection system tape measure protein [Pseudomonadota bacterium]